MKKILLIGTGGTIASDVTEDGLAPELTSEQLLNHLPAISSICDVECIQLLNLDSTNMRPEHWLDMVRCIRENYDRYDGFVITHGTDTMAYTSDLPGVSIVFNNHVILGTRARKTRTKSFQAFSSINYPDLGILRDGVLLRYIRQDCTTVPTFSDTLDNKVALLKLTPGQDRSAADFFLERNDALIIESFGVGGLPEHGGFYDCLQSWIEQGKFVVLTTQVPSEGSDVGVYHVGHSLKANLRVLEAYDMTTEAVVAKLMWILGRTHDRTEVEKLFYTPIAKDILFPVHGLGL